MKPLTPKQQRFVAEYLVDTARFWTFVDQSLPDGCWLWRGACDQAGYGRFRGERDGKSQSLLAHRIAFAITYGSLPRCVCHRCDTPPCVNPLHLFAGTHADNNRDMVRKGRHAAQRGTQHHTQGMGHPLAKLTDTDIPLIRATYALNHTPQRELARRYGVSQRTIAKVVARRGWTHV